MTDYERYQLEWMIDHGHSLGELVGALADIDLDGFSNVRGVFDFWERDVGFGGEVWACEAEWCDADGKKGAAVWDEGIEMAQTAYALDEALANGDTGRIIELAELLAHQVKDEVGGHAENEGWYEEYVHMVIFERALIENGLEQGLIQVEPEDDLDVRITIGENWFWARVPEKLVPHEGGHFTGLSAKEFTDIVMSALAELSHDPTDYADELAYYSSYLQEHVRCPSEGHPSLEEVNPDVSLTTSTVDLGETTGSLVGRSDQAELNPER